MKTPEASIIISCHNEEELLPYSIEAVNRQVQSLPGQELIIVVNGSTDRSADIARNIETEMPTKIIETPIAGKKQAMNLGIHAAKSDFIIFNDADSIMPEDIVFHAIDALETENIRLAGAPRMPLRSADESGLSENNFQTAFYIMNYARRVARPDQKTVQGWFMAMNKKRLGGKLEFPHGASPDDTWLSAYVGSKFGTESIHYLSRFPGEYIPPMTEEDMLAQAARHSLCRKLVRHEHPEISSYFDVVERYYDNSMDEDEFYKKWRIATINLGVDFDKWIDEYNDFKNQINVEAINLFDTLVSMNGIWKRIESSKTRTIVGTGKKHAS